jgi:chorismate dehydratase
VEEFKGKLGLYKLIKTDDNTETVWSEYFSEACHNLSGARDETYHNYIHGCHLPDFFNLNQPLHILDVGFGVGMGLACLIEFVETNSFATTPIHYTSIELDDSFALWTLDKYLPELKLLKNNLHDLEYLRGTYKNININIFLGDGRITLPCAFDKKLLPKFNIIFQDPFSPKKNPTLWTVEWFKFLKQSSLENIRLATYSASVSIRKSMVAAGWVIENHRGFGNKKSMTQASLSGSIKSELLEQLARSPAQELHDLEILTI